MKLKKIIKHLLKFFDKKAKKQRKEQSALHQLLQEQLALLQFHIHQGGHQRVVEGVMLV